MLRLELVLAFILRIADHGIGLSGSGLSVSEQRGVEALPGVLQHSGAQVVEDFFLKVQTFVNRSSRVKLGDH